MRVFHCCTLGLVFVLSTFLISHSSAQQLPQVDQKDLAPVSATYAFTNTSVTQAPGRKATQVTLVMKNGLIAGIGKNIPVPADAIIIKGDSLHIYAGFIDGFSRTGVVKPKDDPAANRERPKDPGNPQPEVAGIMPHQDVTNFLNVSDKSIDDLRSNGFAVSQVAAYGGMLPGSAAIILLNGKNPDQMIFEPRSGFVSELAPAQRVYPNTVIGVMAKWRELYRQAVLAKNYESTYRSNSTGMQRPATDRVLEAFYPVIDKRLPVIFKAEKLLDAQKALILQSEFGFPLILTDLKEGWEITSKLKATGTRVFLSLDLPEESKKPDSTAIYPPVNSDKERQALEKRKSESIKQFVSQAYAFQKAGIPFGFSCGNVKSTDIAKNLRRLIASGLTEDELLAALTTTPANLLGISDRLGTVEPGKIANLVISDKPIFNEKAKIRYVFVDGVMYKYDPKDLRKSPPAAINIAGIWTVISQTPEGALEEKVSFQREGNGYTGSLTGPRFEQAVSLESIELTGNKLKYSYVIQAEGQSVKIDVDVSIEGNSFSGTSAAGRFGTFHVTGTKDPNNK